MPGFFIADAGWALKAQIVSNFKSSQIRCEQIQQSAPGFLSLILMVNLRINRTPAMKGAGIYFNLSIYTCGIVGFPQRHFRLRIILIIIVSNAMQHGRPGLRNK